MNQPAKIGFLAALGLFAVSPLISNSVNPRVYSTGDGFENQEIIAERNSNAFAVLLGEFRTNLSDMLFIKTERYLHGGIGYMPHLNLDKMAQSGEIEDKSDSASEPEPDEEHHDDHASPYEEDDHDDGGIAATIIPDEETDFRGFIGDLHRRVKPWQDPSLDHVHSSGEELLPWYRVMTLSDPYNVRAYLIGGWWLKTKIKDDEKYAQEALNYVQEGWENNPKAFQMPLMLGYIHNELDRPEQAYTHFVDAAELVDDNRPPNGTDDPSWTEYQEEDARAAVRLAVFLARDLGEPEKALEMARRYNETLGGDGRLEVNIRQLEEELGVIQD